MALWELNLLDLISSVAAEPHRRTLVRGKRERFDSKKPRGQADFSVKG